MRNLVLSAGAVFAVIVGGCAVSTQDPAPAPTPDVQVAQASDTLTYTTGGVTVAIKGEAHNGLADGSSLTVTVAGGTYVMTRVGDNGHTIATGRDGTTTLTLTHQDRLDLKAAADAATKQNQARVGAVLQMIADDLGPGDHETAHLLHTKVLNAQGSRCWEAQNNAWGGSGGQNWVWTSYWSDTGCSWRSCPHYYYTSGWAYVGPNTDSCFGLCGPGCNGLGFSVYTDECTNHDKCVRDKTGSDGWSGIIDIHCDAIFPAAAWSLAADPNCF